ncbi:hypothetical protein PHLCEN_2v9648 [Hermanssonia centrifuga]|uniref:Uncharacterized protein n=1 Tax=Hermanssonia centrifuga TaxID=98765 RepID=A0A2R6NQ52_9APHY|nr:hypothetical protein PHLCEN_2v9648 [Hermanssonia centrifuga]
MSALVREFLVVRHEGDLPEVRNVRWSAIFYEASRTCNLRITSTPSRRSIWASFSSKIEDAGNGQASRPSHKMASSDCAQLLNMESRTVKLISALVRHKFDARTPITCKSEAKVLKYRCVNRVWNRLPSSSTRNLA